MSSLYPSTLIDTLSANNFYTVEHGCLVAFPLELLAGQAREIIIAHMAPGIQDHSLRVWVSRADDIGGETLGTGLTTAFWHPNRTPTEKVTVYDSTLDRPAGNVIALEPGNYLVNVLNMVNSRNGFSFVLTDLD